MKKLNKTSVLIVGHGSLGKPLAEQLSDQFQVSCLSRALPPNAQDLAYDCLAGNLSDPNSLQVLKEKQFDQIVVAIAPKERTDQAYLDTYVRGLQHLIQHITENKKTIKRPYRLFFVSSTSVYHQNDNAWVDESSPTLPSSFSGKRLLEAEQLAQSSAIPATIIRFSGIYGGNRTRLIQQALSTTPSSLQQLTPFTNRIHQDDCVSILCHFIKMAEQKNTRLSHCYLCSDSQPARLNEIKQFIRQRVIEKLKVATSQEANNALKALENMRSNNPENQTRRAGSKRCSNRRLIETNYHLHFPDYQSGYQDMIEKLSLSSLIAYI